MSVYLSRFMEQHAVYLLGFYRTRLSMSITRQLLYDSLISLRQITLSHLTAESIIILKQALNSTLLD